MDVSQSLSSVLSSDNSIPSQNPASNTDQLVLNSLGDNSQGGGGDAASVNLDFASIYKSLAIGTKQLIDKINEALGSAVPGGVQSLKPEDVTPDATATKIVQGIAGLFDTFAKQNANLSPEDLLNKFLDQAKKGIDQGFGDAQSTLENLGAFQVDGVKDGIDQTKQLIEQKLEAFADQKRKELGIDGGSSDVSSQTSASTQSALLAQAGGSILSVAA
jgi:hypothetical protein